MPDIYLHITDLTISSSLFIVVYLIGKIMMKSYHTWFRFNAPLIAVMIVGSVGWNKGQKALIKRE